MLMPKRIRRPCQSYSNVNFRANSPARQPGSSLRSTDSRRSTYSNAVVDQVAIRIVKEILGRAGHEQVSQVVWTMVGIGAIVEHARYCDSLPESGAELSTASSARKYSPCRLVGLEIDRDRGIRMSGTEALDKTGHRAAGVLVEGIGRVSGRAQGKASRFVEFPASSKKLLDVSTAT